jgi:hypothetical protein
LPLCLDLSRHFSHCHQFGLELIRGSQELFRHLIQMLFSLTYQNCHFISLVRLEKNRISTSIWDVRLCQPLWDILRTFLQEIQLYRMRIYFSRH